MKWNRTGDPQRWDASDGRHHALATGSSFVNERSYTGRIYVLPSQLPLWGHAEPELVEGSARWGHTIEAALRVCIMAFDPEAVLPERNDGFSELCRREAAIRE